MIIEITTTDSTHRITVVGPDESTADEIAEMHGYDVTEVDVSVVS